ncbi:MAG: IS21 family transposase, partial [Bacteroidota bacterium]|nr:IS21 family transposase [Bacteroidota bacterium]
MFKIRQVLRLYADGRGSKFISRSTGIARNTVKKYLLQFVELRLTIERVETMSDKQLATAFLIEKPKKESSREIDLEALLPELAAKLKKRGVTKQMVYEDYAGQCSGAYKHSAFLERLNVYMGMSKPSMRVPHKVGDKLFIDFTGKRLQIVDQETGEVQEVEVFVAILGCSQLTYVTAVASQKKEDFIAACERALHFYGGVPEAIVPDNLKSAVKKASRYEAELNDSFAAFAAHYNTYVFPARVYKPKDKALVEGAVKIIYTTIFTKIDQKVYTSLEMINEDISIYLKAHNNTLLTGCDYSRWQQFEALEKNVLKPLNQYPYDPMTTKTATVGKTGFVTVDYHYYSVPYKFIGKKIKLMYNRTKVEAFSEHELIAVHVRSFDKEKYIQNEDHLASWHKYPTEWNPEKFIADAALIGEVVVAYIKKVLSRNEYPEKNYRACQGIINYKKRVGETRLINACRRADSFNVYNFGIIERILKSKADFIALEDD